MDFNAPVAGPSKARAQNAKNVSALADITLPEHHFGDYADESLGFDYGDAGPIGGDDFDLGLDDLLDLGLEVEMGLGEEEAGKGKKRAREEDEESVERGRDAMGSEAHASARGSSAAPELDEFGKEGGEGMVEMDVDMGGMGDFDFGDFGGGGEDDLKDQRESSESLLSWGWARERELMRWWVQRPWPGSKSPSD